ncbi:MAG: hypothetical protein ACXVCP_04650 [Bdellovibrio sp.]
MKVKLAVICLVATSLTSAAFAGSDTVDCATASKSISFSVGNGDHKINIKMKDKKTGKASTYQTDVKLMPEYDYNVNSEADKIVAALPVGHATMLKSDDRVMVVYTKDGKLKCSGRELGDETYKQTMLLTQRNFNTENQSFFFEVVDGKSVPGLDPSTGYITAEFICRHKVVTTAGGCYADEGDIVKIEKQK